MLCGDHLIKDLHHRSGKVGKGMEQRQTIFDENGVLVVGRSSGVASSRRAAIHVSSPQCIATKKTMIRE